MSSTLTVTTQGPLYPPSEVMNSDGDFVVVGRVNRRGPDGEVTSPWGSAIVSAHGPVPPFGQNQPYDIVREISPDDDDMVLYTLPVPLPCNNYPMVFAPEQDAGRSARPSYPFHEVPIPDQRLADGPKITRAVTLGQWLRAEGTVDVRVSPDRGHATFRFEFSGLVPSSLYTVMSLREHDLDPTGPTRPGPLGIPNVFVADENGDARYSATLPNPFPIDGNRVISVIVLWMSYQRSYGGAIGQFGLGGDIHAQLKLTGPDFLDHTTIDLEERSCPSSR